MKKIIVASLVLTFLIVGTLILFASKSTEKFKVLGNCSLCKSRIEKAALSVDGVFSANWDEKTNMVEIDMDKSKTDILKIQMSIANAGHDTEMYKTNNETYNSLLGCCKYNRVNVQTDVNGHECKKDHKVEENSGCTRSQKDSNSSSCCDKG